MHPAAQRTVAAQLLNQPEHGKKIIVTTHSPIVVDEAKFGEVVLCRDHQFYEPNPVTDSVRDSVNPSLLSGFGAEMIFGSSVLLVEGEGDRQFFERLRRRLSQVDPSGTLDRCFVVPVGSKSRFGPWLHLLNAYGDAGNRPIRYIVVPDADAATDIRTCFRDAGLTLSQDLSEELQRMSASSGRDDFAGWRGAVDRANRLTRENNIPLHFLKLDLEEAMLNSASENILQILVTECRWTDSPSREGIMQRLGAKGHNGNNGRKDVYLRGMIGEYIPPDDLTVNVKQCLRRWIANASSSYRADQVMSSWRT